MPRRPTAVDVYLLAKISALYYRHGRTQQQIADRFGISRPRVSQLLKEAQERGIVQILVMAPEGMHVELENGLEERYGLAEALVADGDPGDSIEMARQQIGAAAAAYLARVIEPGQAIGIAWGPTLNEMVQAVAPLPTPGVSVVQLAGGIGEPNASIYATEIVRRLAQRLDARAVVLPAPGLVASPEAREVLSNDLHVRAGLKQLGVLDLAFVGIGRADHNPVVREGHAWIPGLVRTLEDEDAVGDIMLRFFDAEGRLIPTVLDRHLLGIDTEQLDRVGRLVAVSSGAHKVGAIRGALRTGLIDVLITDAPTAEQLLL